MESDEDDNGKFLASCVRPHSSARNDVRSNAGSVSDVGGSRSIGPSDIRSISADGRNNFVLGGSPVYQAAPRGPSPQQIVCISSQWERDEIVHESQQALYKGPRMVTDMYYKHALLMEFDTPDDAAIVMAHLSIVMHFVSLFLVSTVIQRGTFKWLPHQNEIVDQRNMCSLNEYDNHCNDVLPGGTFQQNWLTSSNTLVNPAQGDHRYSVSGNPSCVPRTVCDTDISDALSPFVQQPIYSPPNTSWDARSLGHQISPSGIAVTSSQTQGPPPPQHVSGPFVPPPVPPVSQSQGPQVHHFDQAYPASPLGHSLPSLTESLLQAQSHPPPPEMIPSPPQAQPPLLPQAHSPLVPPPPINPTFANIPMDSQICKHIILIL
ncbi:hypothetical protein F2Q70_00021268 [Brassica cretica]|uniref:Uncharacterized protein n=1 Tax=Brassica cretica TaxID=69181 RepID=A0A8S9GRI1_BRACR|nr:hypothetical protein F2Q70_00021268 [Brassica cretica]